MFSDNQIRVLPEQVINQIAAGEVIERPAAAVKELLENSLDAGATQIEVEFSGGGKTYIRIEDNGCGMSPEQALLALERHATSKLRRTSDLLTLRSLGFRGEALPSVASVSRFTLRTRARDADHGTELLVDAGRLVHSRQCGLGYGTRIEVAHLFAPVPARRKFLKSDATEGAHIVQLVRLHALGRPDVGFHLIENGRTVFRSAPCPTMRDRVAEIWGAQLAAELIELPDVPPLSAQAGLRLRGLVGKVGHGRSTRRDMIWLLNGRPIESRLLDNALIDAYQGFLPKGRSPLAFLFLEIDPAAVDVNIHPSKKQVRFGAEGLVRHFVFKTVLDLLEQSVHSTLGSDGASSSREHFTTGNNLAGGSSLRLQDTATGESSAKTEPGAPVELREGYGLRPIPRRSLAQASSQAGGTGQATGEAGHGSGYGTGKAEQGTDKTEHSTGKAELATEADKRVGETGGRTDGRSGSAPAELAGDPLAGEPPQRAAIPRPTLRPTAPQPMAEPSGAERDLATDGKQADLAAQHGDVATGNQLGKPAVGNQQADSTAGGRQGALAGAQGNLATGDTQETPAAAKTGAGALPAQQAGNGLADGDDADADIPQWQFLGRLHREYALMQTPNGLVALRLRAAHERVWFERIRSYFKDEDCPSQQLLLPLSIELDPLAAAALQEHLGFFNAHGFEIETFGRNFYRIHAHPGWLAPERVEPFVRDCVEYARRGELKQKGQKTALEGLAKLAATRAIRLGDQLSSAQIEALCAALLRCENPLTCPNGKPTLIEWSLAELGRRFGLPR